ncbi:MAG TPA: hypothetical protein VF725_00135, partial [Ktedonobacterales bacterium]
MEPSDNVAPAQSAMPSDMTSEPTEQETALAPDDEAMQAQSAATEDGANAEASAAEEAMPTADAAPAEEAPENPVEGLIHSAMSALEEMGQAVSAAMSRLSSALSTHAATTTAAPA